MKALRVIYSKDNQIISTYGLEGPGVYPVSLEDYLRTYLDCKGLELTDPTQITRFLASDGNIVSDDKVIVGAPRPSSSETPRRDLMKELDNLKAQLAAKSVI